MKIIFEDHGQKVIWDLPEISIHDDIAKVRAPLDDISCVSLEVEVEAVVDCTNRLRRALTNSLKVYGTENVDPVRAIIALLCKEWDGDKSFDFNRVLGDSWPEDYEQVRKKKHD